MRMQGRHDSTGSTRVTLLANPKHTQNMQSCSSMHVYNVVYNIVCHVSRALVLEVQELRDA